MSDEQEFVEAPAPDPVPDPVPDAPVPDPVPDPVVETAPEPPVGPQYFYVEYTAPAGVELPLQAAGRWWMANSVHVLYTTCADELRGTPHFRIVGDAPTPAVPFDCGCGH